MNPLTLAHPVVRLALAPVCLAQGLMVRRRATILPEAAGPRTGITGKGPSLRLLIVGDSSAAGVGVSHLDAALSGRLVAELADFQLHWRIEARTGATTASALAALESQQPGAFDAAVVALGVNDVTRQVPLRRWLAMQIALTGLLTDRFRCRHVYLSGVPPLGHFPLLPQPLRAVLGARAAVFDAALAAQAGGHAVLRHLPFDAAALDTALMAEDGFHPGPEIYRHWAAGLATLIRTDFAHGGGSCGV
ncbi:MAG: SGNH/GDSL hydrolase family protein [Pararhodobacter sp.]|nr:SGNH/GDSL hydrolase family protein [Pararhodobacter sp.]